MSQRLLGMGAAIGAIGAMLAVSAAGPAQAQEKSQEKKEYVIALSNAYYGNTWRHQMVEAFGAAAAAAKERGLVSDVLILNGDNSVNQQMSQMSDLILKHVDAIAIDAASETALNGIIAKACKAGIKVVAFDSLASAPCATKLNFDFSGYPVEMTDWIANKIGGQGNIVVVRGVKGSAPDHDIYESQMKALGKYPGIKVAATVYGQATTSVAQAAVSNVLPSLPHIAAVLDQGGGDDYGIAQAFDQYGGPYAGKMPVIAGGGSSNFIHWWTEQHEKSGYTTISVNTTPGIGAAVFWLTLNILQGANAPNYMIMPVAKVTQENLADFASMRPGEIVSPTYSNDWVKQNLLTQKGQ